MYSATCNCADCALIRSRRRTESVHCKFCGIAHEPGHNGCSGWPNYGDALPAEEGLMTVSLSTLAAGARFRVADGYLARGGSSDAGVLTVAGPSREFGRIATTDGRALHACTAVIPEPRRESDAWVAVTRRAEEIRENTGCSWESACARAELEAELSTIANR